MYADWWRKWLYGGRYEGRNGCNLAAGGAAGAAGQAVLQRLWAYDYAGADFKRDGNGGVHGRCGVFGAMVLTIADGVPFLDAAFETASAMGTVGLTCGLTPTLGVVSQAILIILMFFGRVGIMTFGVGFLLRDNAADRYHYAPAKMMIG